ncbi:MAG: alpha/beta hydrolase [Anaerolineales bacterium]|nr:alpha/beta hydrolase [Anaerolineales bacterium]
MAKLQAYQQAHPETTIDLIGHSAGSIVIAHLLTQTKRDYPDLHFRRVIFLAPALTMDLFYKQVVTQQGQYDAFVCFTMKEERELADMVFKPVYPHSLLYFVSGVLEGDTIAPLTGLARFYITPPHGKLPVQEPYILDCRDFLLADGRLVLSDTSPSAPSGQRCLALNHGAFNEEAQTLASLQYLVAAPTI